MRKLNLGMKELVYVSKAFVKTMREGYSLYDMGYYSGCSNSMAQPLSSIFCAMGQKRAS